MWLYQIKNKNGVISYGVSSYGYDARVSDEFKVFTNVNNGVGLFASKYKKSINSYMAVNSILELCLEVRLCVYSLLFQRKFFFYQTVYLPYVLAL